MSNEGVYSDFYQIIESTFSNAVSSQHGGAISCDSQSLKVCIIYSSFLSCVSTYSSSSDGGGGGACYLNIDQGVLQYTYCNKCQSPIIGSAIYLESKSLNDLNSSCLSAIFCCPYSKANLQSIYGYMRGTCNIDNINISNCISQNYYGALHFGLDPVFISSSYINIVFDNSDSYRYPLSTSLKINNNISKSSLLYLLLQRNKWNNWNLEWKPYVFRVCCLWLFWRTNLYN